MINYILHVSLLLGLGFILYQVLLKKETFYNLNRLILAAYLVLAFALPLIHIPESWSLASANEPSKIVEAISTEAINDIAPKGMTPIKIDAVTIAKSTQNNSIIEDNEALMNATNTSPKTVENKSWNIDWKSAIKWTYIVGLCIFLINFLVQFGILIFYRLKYPTLKDGKMTIVEMNGDKAPFSFLNMIYINPTKYDYDTYEQILAHEKIHITKWHSADIFLSELALIVQWFNPFAWYYRKAVEHNLEYLTDQEMLASGANAEVYQMNLLKVSVPELPLALSTNYNQSFLKKRIQMMNTKKSSAQSTWKYLFILPILALNVALLNPTYAIAQPTNKAEKATNKMADNAKIKSQKNDQQIDQQNITLQKVEVVNPTTPKNAGIIQPIESTNIELISHVDIDVMSDLSDLGLENEEGLSVVSKSEGLTITTQSGKSYTLDTDRDRTIIKSTEEDLETKGIWEAEIDGKNVCFYIKKGGISKNYFWSSTECMKTSEFSPEIKKDTEGEFTLKRAAGTMVLKGEFEGNNGTGRYTFESDPSYISYIKAQGYSVEEKKVIHFFLSDIDKEYFAFLKKEGYTNLDEDEILGMAIHGVDQEYIQDINGEFRKVNYKKPSVDELIAMKIHDVDMDYIKSFGSEMYEDFTVDQIIAAAIHNVDPNFISEFQAMGFKDLDFDDLISAAIHDVNADYIKELKNAGFNDLTFDNIVSASIHNVDPDYIKKFKKAGFDDLDFDDMISAAIHNVDPNYITAFEDAGMKNINFDQLVSASIHNVDLDYIKEFKDVGMDNMDFDDLISASIHNADPEFLIKAQAYGFDLDFDDLITASIHNVDLKYLDAFKKAGFDDFEFEDLVTASIHNIDPDMITEFHELGYDDLSFEDITTASIHNIKPRFIKEIREAGLEDISFEDMVSFGIHNIDVSDIKGLQELGFDLDADEMISAGIHNVTPRFIKKMQAKGYKDLSFEEYTKLKIHGF